MPGTPTIHDVLWKQQEEAWKYVADCVTVEPKKRKRECNDEQALPPKKLRKKHELTVVLSKFAHTFAEDVGGDISPVVPSQARCIPEPPWLTALLTGVV